MAKKREKSVNSEEEKTTKATGRKVAKNGKKTTSTKRSAKKSVSEKATSKKSTGKSTTAKKSTSRKSSAGKTKASAKKTGAGKTAAKKNASAKAEKKGKASTKKKAASTRTRKGSKSKATSKTPRKTATSKKKESLDTIRPGAIKSTVDIESTKYEMTSPSPVKTEQVFPEHPAELPEEYEDTRVVLLVRDPEWVFAYWDIAPETRREHKIEKGRHDKTMALRIYDITGIDPQEEEANRYYDIVINDYATSWYLRIPEVDRTWRVDLGYYDPGNGDFVTLARSNWVRTPPSGMSSYESEEVEWMRVDQENFEEILRLSGGLHSTQDIRGSENVMKAISEKLKIQVKEGVSSGSLASGQIMKKEESGGKKFWLVVNTDLIVYGATEPDATVMIQGNPVKLRKDGSFSMRFTLSDGTISIPVKAVNADDDRECEIVPEVSRKTR